MPNQVILHNIQEVPSEGFSFNVFNQNREIRFDFNGFKLRSSACPEYSSNFLFIQGANTENDDIRITVPHTHIKGVLRLVEAYNSSVGCLSPFISDFLFPCSICGDKHIISDFHEKHNDVCLPCMANAKVCVNCGSVHGAISFCGEWFCTNCLAKTTCQNCGTHTFARRKNVMVPSDYHGDSKTVTLCESCYNTEIYFGKEHHYHYVPELFNFWDIDKKGLRKKLNHAPDRKLYMGTEIECIFKDKTHTNIEIGKILNVYGVEKESILYAKHDGTVPEPGTEIVTHPLTLAFIKSLSWEGLYQAIVKPYNFEIGGHIHINKNAFWSVGHTYKFLRFLRTNVQYVEWLGERPLQDDWCKGSSENGKAVRIAKKFRENVNGDRYEMINFTSKTIELRFFFTPYTVNSLYKNAEFVDALYNFTINAPLHFTYQMFEEFVKDNMSKYAYLYNFIHTRNRIGVRFHTNEEVLDDYDRDDCDLDFDNFDDDCDDD